VEGAAGIANGIANCKLQIATRNRTAFASLLRANLHLQFPITNLHARFHRRLPASLPGWLWTHQVAEEAAPRRREG
jgi:hypothetical protein